jgi:L-aminopeptidase/D-esterase-like protein
MTTASLGFGFRVGHWSDEAAGTGCTVVIPPRGNVASVEVRGSSPGSRELVSLHPSRRLDEVHAVMLAGGSAFGLAAAQGAVDWLEEQGIGYETPIATIPIVPSAVVFDLGTITGRIRPGPAEGRAACGAATEDPLPTGRVGAGTGATVGKWAGRDHLAPGGLGIGSAEAEGAKVTALAVVNAIGDVLAEDGTVLAGTSAPDPKFRLAASPSPAAPENTVLVIAVTRANLAKREVHFLAGRAADGVTATVRPAHTRYDGDVAFAIAAPGGEDEPPPNVDVLGLLARTAVTAAVRNAVTPATERS